MNAFRLSTLSVAVALLVPHYSSAEPKPAAALHFPGSSPIAAANLQGKPRPACGDNLDGLVAFESNLFVFDQPGPFVNGQQAYLNSPTVSVMNPGYQGSYWSQWYFIDYFSSVPSVYQSQPFNEVLGFAQAERFTSYLRDELGIAGVPPVYIQYDWAGNSGGPQTLSFGGIVTIPGSVQGPCGTVYWLSDGDVMPHEVGGHRIPGLYSDPENRLGEPLGDYWALVATWDENANPALQIGDWVNEMFGGDGVYLRDLDQTAIAFPYGLLGADASRRNHRNGQVLTAALWELRSRLRDQYGLVEGAHLADYLVYAVGAQAKQRISAAANNDTHALFSWTRDELVRQLELLQAQPNDGSYRDFAKQIDAAFVRAAFDAKSVLAVFPNDPYFNSQAAFFSMGGTAANQFHPARNANGAVTGHQATTAQVDVRAPQAWAKQTGRRDVVIAELDMGVYLAHEDLYENMWVNQGELPASMLAQGDVDGDGLVTLYDLNRNPAVAIPDLNGNGYIDGEDLYAAVADGSDNDGNGKTDDVVGWSTWQGDGVPLIPGEHLGFGYTQLYHGTQTCGVMGAMTGNGRGVSGINHKVQMLPVHAFESTATNPVALMEAIDYARTAGAHVIQAPWALAPWGLTDDGLYKSVERLYAANVPYVAAVGNSQSGVVDDNDASPYYPQTYPLPNVLTVTAIDANGQQQQRYGRYTVDLAATTDSYTTLVLFNGDSAYAPLGQTSGASPHVSGALGLLVAEQKDRQDAQPGYRSLTLGEIRYLLLTSVDPYPSLKNKTVSGGSLNVENLLNAYRDQDMDGYADVVETLFGTDPANVASLPDLMADADGDGLSNGDELAYGTIAVPVQIGSDLRGKLYPIYLDDNGHLLSTPTEGGQPPSAADTDGDGDSDALEVALGSDPANPFVKNLLGNPSMEAGAGAPDAWWWANGTTNLWAQDTAHSGSRSLQLVNATGQQLRWQSTAVSGTDGKKTLTISGWSKAAGVNLGTNGTYRVIAQVALDNGGGETLTPVELTFAPGTHDWERVSFTKTFAAPVRFVFLELQLGDGATGTAWFDDVSLQLAP